MRNAFGNPVLKMFLRSRLVALLLVFTCIYQPAHATHYRAGEIIYRRLNNLTYEATIITYCKVSPPSNLADRDSVVIDWGDGSSDVLVRVNGIDADGNGVPDGENLGNDIKVNKYTGRHSYTGVPPAPNNFFIISFYDENRMAGINNIDGGNSVNVPFYVEDTVKFPNDVANIGYNSSPVLYHPPIDFANLNDTFYHNPVAIDPDGDSLDYQLIPPRQDQSSDVPVYQYPDVFCHGHSYPANTFIIDRHTGEVVWAVPCYVGIFNIAILITEYRNGVEMGTLVRDMQIIVLQNNNHPPQIAQVPDTCIRAGDTLVMHITASDPDAGQTVTLTAEGGPFVSSPPANFTSAPSNPTQGTFVWTPSCDAIQGQPYEVVFVARDNFNLGGAAQPLTDLMTAMIRVVPPPVKNVTATPGNNIITISWQNPYSCAGATNFRGFSVWRRVGCDGAVPGYCQTGMDGSGYTEIAHNISQYSFTDSNTVVGQAYSYIIVPNFYRLSPNGIFAYDYVSGVPSDPVCVFMPINVPVMLNVDVQQTDLANGKIYVRWTKPLADSLNFDTTQHLPPYRFELFRGSGNNFQNPQLIHSSPVASAFYLLTDTEFVDQGIDTKTGPWSYRVAFYSANDTIGYSAKASSVFLNIQTSDRSLVLNWNEHVPWTNDSFSVFRLNKVTTLFDSIGISYSHAFVDSGLINDSVYCYYVKGYGHYTLLGFPAPLINKSEEDCAVPTDTTAPCPPVLSVRNDCDIYYNQPWGVDQFTNYLTWAEPDDSCSIDVDRYFIYFSNDSSAFTLIDSVVGRNDTAYNHVRIDNSLAGCYVVTALDHERNQSAYSNVVCVDNCPYYVLPNVFTPNGDGHNDYFHPFKPYRFVEKIDMKVYNRWGELVFETHDPEIHWDGTDKAGKKVNDGYYPYAGYYYVQGINGLVRYPLSGQKKGGGMIQVITGK